MRRRKVKKKDPFDLNVMFKRFASQVELRKEESPTLRKCARGSAKSRIICVFHPFDADIEKQNLFASEENSFAVRSMQQMGIAVHDFFCIPSYLAESPRNGTTMPIRDFLSETALMKDVTDYVIVGTEAFRWTIGRGAKPDSRSLIGNPIFPSVVQNKRVLTLGDTHKLFAPDDADYYTRRNADEQKEAFLESCQKVAKIL